MVEDAWQIRGGSPLRGAVRPAGSKNGGLPTLAATLLIEGETILENVPRITDVETMAELLRVFGLGVERVREDSLRVVNRGLKTCRPPEDLVGKMRASHYLLGPLLARLGEAQLPLPGGCDIGSRPVGYIISGLQALGGQARVDDSGIKVEARKLRGTTLSLDPRYRSAGATFNVLMAAVLADGTTVVENASFEPDVVSFCHFLNSAGARIEGIGEPRLVVRGVESLHGTTHRINPDRLEAGTFMCAAAVTRGTVTVNGIRRRDLEAVAAALEQAGVEVAETEEDLRVSCPGRPRGIALVTEPYPGFPTDLQPPTGALLATAEGTSTVRESIFDRRLQYVEELAKMGARIELTDSRNAVIRGVARLRGARVEVRNIRDGAALVVAALGAEGESLIIGRQFVVRGYDGLESKLRALGASLGPV
jgi:UDP-N-acetylglucosamine 1-carboxyvinyltransferase